MASFAVFALVGVLLVLPFLQHVLAAILLGYILYPLQRRLAPHVGSRLSSGLLLVVATVAFLLPFAAVAGAVIEEATRLWIAIREGRLDLTTVESYVLRYSGIEVDISALLQSSGENGATQLVGNLIGVFGAATHALIGLGLTLFLLYYFLKDGDSLVRWMRSVTPLPSDVQDDLYSEIDDVMWAVFAGHVFVAVVQGVVAGVGLFVTEIPNALFWTAVMVVLALLPLIGAFMVWGPAAIYLFVNGQPLAAAFLVVYGTVVVGITDDYLRPIVVDRHAELNPAVIILGLVGGIYVMGFMGIFFGPVALGVLKAIIDVLGEEYSRPETGE
ncbi:AI-2E family transporter [Halobacterium noricense]